MGLIFPPHDFRLDGLAECRAEAETLYHPPGRHRCPDPENAEVVEAESVSAALALSASVRAIGASQLLHARMNWERLFSSANPPGAATPAIARDSLTRQAIRRKEDRRRAYRSGASGLLAAIRAA